MILAHLTDIHLGPVPKPRFSELLSKRFFGYLSWQRRRHLMHRIELLEAIRQHLNAEPVDHVAISGDLVNISLPGEFDRAHRWLQRLGQASEISVIPGNHDAYIGKTYLAGWRLWRDYMSSDVKTAGNDTIFPTVRRRGRLLLIGLSSAVPSPIGFAFGEIGESQLERLKTLLAATADRREFRVIQLHHPPLFSPKRRCLRDADAFKAVLAEFGAELVIAGHEHHFHLGSLPGPQSHIPVVAGPSASLMRFDGAHAGGYLRYHLPAERDGSIELYRYGYDPETNAMVQLQAGTLIADPNGCTLSV